MLVNTISATTKPFPSVSQHTVTCVSAASSLVCLSVSAGGPGLDSPYRPRNMTPNKLMPTRPSYPGMVQMPGSMSNMMGMQKEQFQMGYKQQPPIAQNQMLRHQLQVRLVSPMRLGRM